MRLRSGLVVIAILFALVSPSRLSASCTITSVEEQISGAKLIFVGTLVDERALWTPQSIVTRYRFENVGYVKGQGSPDSLILYQDGGRVGNTRIDFADRITFRVGVRYIVLADSEYSGERRPQYCAIGPFAVQSDSAGHSVIIDESGAAIAVFDGQHVVAVSPKEWNPSFGETQPPRVPLREVIQRMDAEYEASLPEYSPEYAEKAKQHLRGVYLYPHQDPGDRVTEKQFLEVLGKVVRRVSSEDAERQK
jgi:hypothetical protein